MSGGKYVDSEGCLNKAPSSLPSPLPTTSRSSGSAWVWKPSFPKRSRRGSATGQGSGSDLRVGLRSCAGTSLHCSHPGTGQHLQAQQQGHGRGDEREASVRRAHQGDRPGQPRPQ
uniref:Uncharacterized protein n=1 Tax=Ovis aries TaxID=9940 RepID=A0AC11EPC0_SHEEP